MNFPSNIAHFIRFSQVFNRNSCVVDLLYLYKYFRRIERFTPHTFVYSLILGSLTFPVMFSKGIFNFPSVIEHFSRSKATSAPILVKIFKASCLFTSQPSEMFPCPTDVVVNIFNLLYNMTSVSFLFIFPERC